MKQYGEFNDLLPSQKTALMRLPLYPSKLCAAFGKLGYSDGGVDGNDRVCSKMAEVFLECGAGVPDTAYQLAEQFLNNAEEWYNGGNIDALMLCLDDLTRIDDKEKCGKVRDEVIAIIR